jgi:hypothetical protein
MLLINLTVLKINLTGLLTDDGVVHVDEVTLLSHGVVHVSQLATQPRRLLTITNISIIWHTITPVVFLLVSIFYCAL